LCVAFDVASSAQASAAGAFAMGKSHDYAARAQIPRSLNETTRESYKFSQECVIRALTCEGRGRLSAFRARAFQHPVNDVI